MFKPACLLVTLLATAVGGAVAAEPAVLKFTVIPPPTVMEPNL